MNKKFDFKNIFVMDLANNHQGDIDHAKKIINLIGKIVKKEKIRAVFKFQFRQLSTFIHSDHKKNSNNKHIPRFLSTELSIDDYKILLSEVKKNGMLSMCTPFDEASVDNIKKMGFDIIKLASCSAKDWPLIEKIADACMPTIFSTGGLEIENIDDLVSFFEHKAIDFAIMHCISVYPTPNNQCNLNQLDYLIRRYKDRHIGWSTHEDPGDIAPIQIAVAKGATIFERHVGLSTDRYKLNQYSSTPDQIEKWIQAYKKGLEICGSSVRKPIIDEIDSIKSLSRGVYAKKKLKKGDVITLEDVFFAMPLLNKQLDSGSFKKGIILKSNVLENEQINNDNIIVKKNDDYLIIKSAIHEVKAFLNEANVVLNSEFEVEYSHHYGIKNFKKVGAVLINCINREYCKKIVVQLPGQSHPLHFHKLKEETFQILHGLLSIEVDGKLKTLYPGDTCLVLPGVWHSFSTTSGCIFEEVSTTHYNNDSIYKDTEINKLKREERKTRVDHWGRFQLPALLNK
tara:strand:+ start:28254 stop:29789 length:1536 start_codon:yes stop_codon:yes gene_type:complete